MDHTSEIKKVIENIIIASCSTRPYHASVAAEAIIQALEAQGFDLISKKKTPFERLKESHK